MSKKFIFTLIFIILCAIIFSGYWHEEDIDDLAYVVALGFDIGESKELKMTFQISIPSATNSNSSGNSGSSSDKGSKDTLTKSIECSSIYSGLNELNSLTSKDVNLSHCKFIVFSDKLAKKGIYKYIYTLENNAELRSTCNILISTCPATEFLSYTNPIFENSTAKYYKIIANSTSYSGFTSNITLNHLYTSISDTFGETCAILGGIKEDNITESVNSSVATSGPSSSSNSSNNSGDQNEKKTDIVVGGLAVFKGENYVGNLTVDETLPYLIITNDLKEAVVSVPSPFDDNSFIDLHLSQNMECSHKVNIRNSVPEITTDVDLNVTLLSNLESSHITSTKQLSELEKAISDYISKLILNYYEKTSKEYKSDIAKLGKYAVHLFPTTQDWIDYDWNSKYETSTFNVNVNVIINTSYFIS